MRARVDLLLAENELCVKLYFDLEFGNKKNVALFHFPDALQTSVPCMPCR